ncbi:MAG: deacylase [endosymbiont of Galathealinum brachiosum]|uniref:Deacylase n=1 Tax=endosymbiont of Galathealinum brachiosum TaxID=2200906 RepID=A0A370DC93_9GAMM|nr:MAG: deacylase [endosymbiont of Galathealinum brachiosum]
MPSQLLKEFLDENDIKYVSIMHSMAFTAVEVAKSAHIPSRELAKTVILNVDDELVMAVVPANYKVDLDILRQTLDTKKIQLAKESEFTPHFKDCEVGAMPPFGCLYDMDVYIAESLSEDDTIAFNAGSHLEAIQMNYKDYENLVKPRFIFLDN